MLGGKTKQQKKTPHNLGPFNVKGIYPIPGLMPDQANSLFQIVLSYCNKLKAHFP